MGEILVQSGNVAVGPLCYLVGGEGVQPFLHYQLTGGGNDALHGLFGPGLFGLLEQSMRKQGIVIHKNQVLTK